MRQWNPWEKVEAFFSFGEDGEEGLGKDKVSKVAAGWHVIERCTDAVTDEPVIVQIAEYLTEELADRLVVMHEACKDIPTGKIKAATQMWLENERFMENRG